MGDFDEAFDLARTPARSGVNINFREGDRSDAFRIHVNDRMARVVANADVPDTRFHS